MQKPRKKESGATAIEFGLIAAQIAVLIIPGVTALGANIDARLGVAATEAANAKK